jgi:hypothetical protein
MPKNLKLEGGQVKARDATSSHTMTLEHYEKHCRDPQFAAEGAPLERAEVNAALAQERARLE